MNSNTSSIFNGGNGDNDDFSVKKISRARKINNPFDEESK